MVGRKVVVYYAWSRPGEVEAPLEVIENRFPTLFESRRMLYPRFEALSDPARTSDLKARNIRVNVLSPGPIQTPGLDAFANDDVKSQLKSMVPLGRIGTPDEVAKVALFLASDDSSYVAGVELFVDGGSVAI